MLNRATIMGRLTSDPEIKTTQNDNKVCNFCVACDRDIPDKSTGERKADFINVVVWRQTADFVSKYFSKGSMIVVDGRIQVRSYTDKDGNKRTATEIVADSVYFGSSKKDNVASENSSAQNQTHASQDIENDDPESEDGLPF